MKRIFLFKVVFLLTCGLFGGTSVVAQLIVTPPTVTFNLNTKALYTNGTNLTFAGQLVKNGLIVLSTVTLSVQATSSAFTSGPNSIPLSNVIVQVTSVKISGISVPGTFPAVPLSTGQQQLILGVSTIAGTTISIGLKYTVIGGTNLLKPGGTYSTGINFSLSTGSTPVTGTVNPFSLNLSDLSSLTLASGSNPATLNFSQASDYKNGVQLTQPLAMNVFSNRSYKVSVSAAANLKNGLNFINIGNISLTTVPNPHSSGITALTTSLSLGAQNILVATQPTLSQNFDLKYFTQAQNGAFVTIPAGTYSTTLTYTITSP